MSAPDVLVTFTGETRRRVDRAGPLGLTLIGACADARVQVAFLCAARDDLPLRLEAPTVRRSPGRGYRIESAAGVWELDAPRAFLHEDATGLISRVIPARRAPAGKRFFWRVVLALAATGMGRRLLFTMRR